MIKKIRSFDGTELSYVINKGSKPFLVFLHGAGSNHSTWKPFLNYFKNNFFIAPDLRGHGRSGRGKVSIENFSKDLKKIFDREKIEKTVIIGNCLGTTIAVNFYKRFPKLVDKLVLITPFSSEIIRLSKPLGFLNNLTLSFVKMFKSRRKLRFQDYHKHMKKPVFYYPLLDIRGTSITTDLSAIKELFDYKLNFDNIKTKTLVIAANRDHFSKLEVIKKMIKKNKNIILRIIDSNHVPLTRNPEKLIKEVDKFLL